jgi:hypothetical protein
LPQKNSLSVASAPQISEHLALLPVSGGPHSHSFVSSSIGVLSVKKAMIENGLSYVNGYSPAPQRSFVASTNAAAHVLPPELGSGSVTPQMQLVRGVQVQQ